MATISEYQTASGATLYRVRYRTPDKQQTDKRGFTTKRDAEQFAASVEVAKMRGDYVAPSVGKVTIGALGPAWLDRQRGHMKPSGFRSYESAWRIHVAPRWAGRRIADVRYSDVQAWVAELAARARAGDRADRLRGAGPDPRRRRAGPDAGVQPGPRGRSYPSEHRGAHVYLTADQLKPLADRVGPVSRPGAAARCRRAAVG